MKKDNSIKEIILKALLGFPIGITILMISYASIYLIAGENAFKNEIAQLQNIYILVLQFTIIGFVYYLFFLLIGLMDYLKNSKIIYDKYLVEHPIKSIFLSLLVILTTVITILLLQLNIFSISIISMNLIAYIIVFIIYGIVVCIKTIIESNIVKKINVKLKEKNK